MIRAIWNRFGFHLIVVFLVVMALLLALPKPTPDSPTIQMDMRKLILYERELNTDVLFVEMEEGVEVVIALWNDDWVETTTLMDFAKKYDPIVLLIDEPVDVIVEVDGEIYYGTVYNNIGMVSCIDGGCGPGPGRGLLNEPEAVDWDWGKH